MTTLARLRPLLAGLVAAALFAAGTPAHAALPQQSGAVDLAAPGANTVADGAGSGDLTGTVVADAGDVNGDGIEDVLVTAPNADANGRRDSGTAYVVFGRANGTAPDLAGIGSGGGFRIDGGAASDHLGSTAAAAGDVNGDGLDDVVVGARDADNRGRLNSGSAYVIFGRTGGSPIDVSSLGSAGFRIDGAAAGDRLGSFVAGGLDVNQDGRADVVVGAPLADPAMRTNAGAVYVIFGSGGPTGVDTAALGAAGIAIDGAGAGDQLGAVALTPDLTGDGRSDVLAGARFADAAGRVDSGAAYLVPGAASSGTVDLAQRGSAFYTAQGADPGDQAGAAVAPAGDLNADGRPDLLLGAPGAGFDGRPGAGSVYALLGAGAGGVQDLGALDSAWRIDGAAAGDGAGLAFAGGRDLNSDGRPDLVVGDPLLDAGGRTDSGSVRVLFGGGFVGIVDLASTHAPGFHVDGAAVSDAAGSSLAALSDVTGDGRADLVVGAPRTDHGGRRDSGSAYFVYGFGAASLAYPPAAAGTAGQAFGPLAPAGVVRTGPVSYSIAPALPTGLVLDPATGVISGTPTDVLEGGGAYTLTMTDLTGSVSLPLTLRVAPRPGPCANPRDGTSANDRITGSSGGDVVHGGTGSDTLDGAAGDDCLFGDDQGDTLFGGDGADTLRGGVGQDFLHGGNGPDQLFGDSGNDQLDGDGGGDVLHGGPGFDELSGGAGNDKLYGDQEAGSLEGGAGNDLLVGGDKADKLVGGEGNDTLVAGAGADIVIDRSGANRIQAGAGNDTIDVRNGKRDVVDCGSGRDRVLADRSDKLVLHCEKVTRTGRHRKRGSRRRRR